MGWGEPPKRVQRVKVAPELVAQLTAGWSDPVQVKLTGRDADGDLELVFRKVDPRDPVKPRKN